jgi:hypothetical protein
MTVRNHGTAINRAATVRERSTRADRVIRAVSAPLRSRLSSQSFSRSRTVI